MDIKYVCPECKSQLKVYREYVFQKEQLINPRSGQVGRKVTSTRAEKVDTPGGLQCTKCSFIYYGLDCVGNNGQEYDYLNELFEVINESEFADETL